MKNAIEKVKQFPKRIRGLLPMRLPVGVTQWNSFCVWVLSAYGFPDLPSYRQALAQMIMHLPQHVVFKTPRWFAQQIKNGQVKQTAYQVVEDARRADKAARDAVLKSVGEPIPDEVAKPATAVESDNVAAAGK